MRRTLVALVAAIALAGCGGSIDVTIPEPPSTVATTSTTVPPDYSGVVLPAVRGRGTTTTVDTRPGRASLAGDVQGPEGPVAGATVRVQRLVGDQVLTTDLVTAADGTWAAQAVQGGRYRVRAWRAPDLATARTELLFLGGTEERRLPLRLDATGGLSVVASTNPSPPVVDEPAGVAVLVADRVVDPTGVVRATPRAFVRVDLYPTGSWRLRSPSPAFTDEGGRAQWIVECEEAGNQALDVVVDQRAVRLTIPPCAAAAPGTTVDSGPATTSTTKPARRRPPSTTTTSLPGA